MVMVKNIKRIEFIPRIKFESSSSRTNWFYRCDHTFKRLQQWRNKGIAIKNDLTAKFVYLFGKDNTRIACLNEDNNNEKKQLHLVLDLDHTLIHSIPTSNLSENEKYLLKGSDSMADLWRVNVTKDQDYLIKLRPFVTKFLKEANKLYIMHVYTMGTSSYAQAVLKLLDPDEVYFGDRVITREESPDKKTLRLVKADKRRVVIVDDTICVWPYHKRNLLRIDKYIYFRENDDKMWRSYAEEKKDESHCNGSLVNVLKFLEKIHKRFEDQEIESRDLRLLMSDDRSRRCCF